LDNILYLAVIFFCQGQQCQVVAIDDPFTDRLACEAKLDEGVALVHQNVPAATIVEPRCLDFRYGTRVQAGGHFANRQAA
jgi:hypothetical protein